jgi:hypothetical protein
MAGSMVDRATTDHLIGPDWAKNMEICDICNRDPGYGPSLPPARFRGSLRDSVFRPQTKCLPELAGAALRLTLDNICYGMSVIVCSELDGIHHFMSWNPHDPGNGSFNEQDGWVQTAANLSN